MQLPNLLNKFGIKVSESIVRSAWSSLYLTENMPKNIWK